MPENELIFRRELERQSSDQLRAILHAETEKEIPDDELVLTILHILEDREPDELAPASEKEEAAWKLFRKRVRARKRKPHLSGRRLANAAVLLLVVGLLIAAIPQQAEADSWWDRLTKWTDEFFGFFREEDTFAVETYGFQTDNPGLQQVYEAVVDMGVTIPVVPMWLPERYELAECTAVATPTKQYIYARFLNSEKECVLKINVLNGETGKDYFKNDVDVQELEKGGVIHGLVQNQDSWIVSWTKDNIECALAIDCSRDVLHEIIDSIYRGRTNE